jgi:hypothetical protein
MNRQVWETIVTINNYISPLDAKDKQIEIKSNDLIELRSKLRIELETIRQLLTEQYSQRDVYLVLSWPSFQEEFYKIDDAGDTFYDLLDDLLTKPDTLPFVYEIYLFCLKDGFLGRYSNYPDTIKDYIKKLNKYISLRPLLDNPTQVAVSHKRIFFRIPNYFYYISAGVLLLGLYYILMFFGSIWKPYE